MIADSAEIVEIVDGAGYVTLLGLFRCLGDGPAQALVQDPDAGAFKK